METLILNAGSSSVKFRLYSGKTIKIDGVIDSIGPDATLSVNGDAHPVPVLDYREAGLVILSLLKVLPGLVIHRVVHGGKRRRPVILSDKECVELSSLIPLAPLHQPANLALVKLFRERTKAMHVACFDTMFHRTMPVHASTYAIPQELAAKYCIQRYGFHGAAHQAMSEFAAVHVGKRKKVITCQLGNGVSIAAVRNGRCIDTSMGFTPLEGLIMGTRSGSIDPAIISFLCVHEQVAPERVMDMLEHESGLLALGGTSDVRELLARERKGDDRAALALEMFCYRITQQIGAYAAIMNGVDAIVLGGGAARSPRIREGILSAMEYLGVVLHQGNMRRRAPVQFGQGSVQLWACEIDEQEVLFRIGSAAIDRSQHAISSTQ